MEAHIPIPAEWLTPVCKILHEGDEKRITWTLRAFQDWQAATMSPFHYEPQDAMADSLSVPGVMGFKANLPEDGSSYAFFFIYKKRTFYGKICLKPNNLNIKIISAHPPLKGETNLS